MTTIVLKKPHELQRKIISDSTRFVVACCSRRIGKTQAGEDWILRQALKKPESINWWIAPTYQQTLKTFRALANIARQMPASQINRAELRIVFYNGSEIYAKSAQNPDNLRGAGLDTVVMDEAAFIQEEIWTDIIRPMLVTTEGRALFLSTPNGRNWFWHLWLRCLDEKQQDWSGHHYTVYDAPHTLIPPDEIEDIRNNVPSQTFRQEFMAEFLEGGGAVFRNLETCVYDEPPTRTGDYVMGVDWGKANDYTVLTVIDRNTQAVLEIDRFNQIDWKLQRGRLIALWERYNRCDILAEANSIGEPNIEELQREGLPIRPFTTTAISKQKIINALALAFEQNEIAIPNNKTLLAELQAFEIEKLPSGNYRYRAPNGMHDDMVMSLALSWHGVLNRPVATYIMA